MPIVQGTANGETLNGTADADSIYGFGGEDTLFGFAGDDFLDGGDGADTMYGEDGNDRYVIDNALDLIVESAGQGDDALHSSVSYRIGDGVSIETMTTTNATSTAAINLSGNEIGNSIYGNAGNNVLNGGGGIDYLVGLGGNDRYIIDNPDDLIVEGLGEGDDALHSSVQYTLAAGVSIETLTTTNEAGTAAIDLIGNDIGNSIYGNAGQNILSGGGGNDYLLGMGGNDTLIGGVGADQLVGGSGADRFVFSDLESGDVIQDFASGTDKIDLGDLLLDANHLFFIGSGAFTGAAGQGRFADGLFQLDMNGDAVADLTITVIGQVVASDFMFDGNPLVDPGFGYWDY